MIEVYTDGGYSSTRDQGGWAFVVVAEGEKIHQAFDAVPETTNNRMEIDGVYYAIRWLLEHDANPEEVVIYTDSMYVIGGLSGNKMKKNLDLWELMWELNNPFTLKHVKGHAGNKWNDYCDVLAVHGSHLILK